MDWFSRGVPFWRFRCALMLSSSPLNRDIVLSIIDIIDGMGTGVIWFVVEVFSASEVLDISRLCPIRLVMDKNSIMLRNRAK